MFKNVATKIALFAFDTTTGAPKTGDAANLTAYVSKDYGAVTVLADTTATEMDATNAKGWYLFDVAQAETNADALLFTGKSSTANISVVAQYIHTTPNRFSSLVIDAAGLADATAVKVGPSGAATAQTAGDITAQLVVIDDYVDTEIAAIKAKTDNLPADPADASDIAAAFSTVNGTLATIAGYVDTEVAAIKAKTDNLPANPAAVSDIPTAIENADALLNRDMSVGTDSGSPTVRTVRQALRFLRNKWSISGTTLTVTKEDDATASWTSTVSTSAGADPVTGNDPA